MVEFAAAFIKKFLNFFNYGVNGYDWFGQQTPSNTTFHSSISFIYKEKTNLIERQRKWSWRFARLLFNERQLNQGSQMNQQLLLMNGVLPRRWPEAHNPQPNQLPLNRPTNQFHFVQLFDWMLFIGVELFCGREANPFHPSMKRSHSFLQVFHSIPNIKEIHLLHWLDFMDWLKGWLGWNWNECVGKKTYNQSLRN